MGRIKREPKVNLHRAMPDLPKARGCPAGRRFHRCHRQRRNRPRSSARKAAEDYWKSYDTLLAAGLNAVPHITIGLRGGLDSGETAALERLTPGPMADSILVPTKGTAFENRANDPVGP